MEVIKINEDNVHILKRFIETVGSSSKHFRYFLNRDYKEAIINHVTTYILHDGGYVGYGHLDKEDNKVWLGVCVSEGFTGRGYGNTIMQHLIDSYDGEIDLSVDSDNKAAIKMYEKFLFKTVNQNNNIIYMRRHP